MSKYILSPIFSRFCPDTQYNFQPSKYVVCVKPKRDESLLYLVKFGKLNAIVDKNFVAKCVEVFNIEAKLDV